MIRLTGTAKHFTSQEWASNLNDGSILFYEGGLSGTLIANIANLSAVASGTGEVIVNDGSGTVSSATTGAGIDAFRLRMSDNTVWAEGENNSTNVPGASQNTADNRLAISSHPFVNDQVVKLSGELPAGGLNSTNGFFVNVYDANQIELLSEPKGSPVAIDSQTTSDLILTIAPAAIGGLGDAALIRFQTGLTYALDEIITFANFSIAAPQAIY